MLKITTLGLDQFAPGGAARKRMLILGPGGSGKGHPLDTKLLTPTGWAEIGKLQVDDEVIGSSGNPVRVTGIYDRGVLPVLKVRFNDGGCVRVDPEHLWWVADAGNHWAVRETENLGALTVPHDGATPLLKWKVPTAAPVQHLAADLPLHPYVMGALLGNGHFADDHTQMTIPFGREWQSQVDAFYDLKPQWMRMNESTSHGSTARRFNLLQCVPIIRELGLEGHLSPDKFVPEIYKWASEDQRRWLLAGLLDTDGGQAKLASRFSSTSPALQHGVVDLVRSLGGFAVPEIVHRTGGKPTEFNVKVRMTVNPFRFGPKPSRWRPAERRTSRWIESVEPDGHAEIRCITVDAEDSLYVTEDYLVTHNTRFSSYSEAPIYAACEPGVASIGDRRTTYGTTESGVRAAEIKNSRDMLDFLEFLHKECMKPLSQRLYLTVVIDTVDAYERKIKEEWISADPARKAFSGYDAWNYLDAKMQQLLTRLLNLDMNVIVLAHFKERTVKDGGDNEHQELGIRLSGNTKDVIFDDFDLVGWMGTFYEVVEGQRVERRGLTFRKTPDRPWLKDRLAMTPPWIPVSFDSDALAYAAHTELSAQLQERLDALAPSVVVEEIPAFDPAAALKEQAPPMPTSGPVPPQTAPETPLASRTVVELRTIARAMKIDGVKGNTTKGEILEMIEAIGGLAAVRKVMAGEEPALPTQSHAVATAAAAAVSALEAVAEAVAGEPEDPTESASASTETPGAEPTPTSPIEEQTEFTEQELAAAAQLPQCMADYGGKLCTWDRGHKAEGHSWNEPGVATMDSAGVVVKVGEKTGVIDEATSRTADEELLATEAAAIAAAKEGLGAVVDRVEVETSPSARTELPRKPPSTHPANTPAILQRPGNCQKCNGPLLAIPADRPEMDSKEQDRFLRLAYIKNQRMHICCGCFLATA